MVRDLTRRGIDDIETFDRYVVLRIPEILLKVQMRLLRKQPFLC
jgi:hypothetical protein